MAKKYFPKKLKSRHNMNLTLTRQEYKGKIYVKSTKKIHVGSQKNYSGSITLAIAMCYTRNTGVNTVKIYTHPVVQVPVLYKKPRFEFL
jgi:hypothetical protein